MTKYIYICITILTFTISLVSCKSNNISLSKGESMFLESLLSDERELMRGYQLIFILNQSYCQPCEEEVVKLYSSEKLEELKKTYIVPDNRKPIEIEADRFIYFSYQDLSKYGLIRANGTVILIDDGSCVLLESIDVNRISDLEQKIVEAVKPN